ncbi:MAG: hypothetical protein Q7R78_01345 [bacterium]|nr:hypothetical protein [bacterium]
MIEQIPSKTEIFKAVNAQSETLDELSKRLVKIEQLADKQESRNVTVIIAVIIAALLIVVTIAVQISVSDKRDRERGDNLLEKVHEVKEKQIELDFRQLESKNNIDSLKIKNPYLK